VPRNDPPPPLTPTEAALLGLLSRGELSGYDLQRAVEQSVGYFWAPAKSRIYAVLPRLVESGLATRREIVQRGRPNKQLYRLTAYGKKALQQWLADPPEPDPDRNALLLKVFFGDLIDDDVILEQVRAKRAQAKELKRDLARHDATAPGRTRDRFPAYTRRYGHEWADAVTRWANFVERDILARRAENLARPHGDAG
jgi:PadR family transcriptional regulator, regulatory protein AphA